MTFFSPFPWWQTAAAFGLDLLVGDPAFFPHPVVLIGKFISWQEKGWRRLVKTPLGLRLAGGFVAFTVPLTAAAVVTLILYLASRLHPWLRVALEIWFISTTVAARGLHRAAAEIDGLLAGGQLAEARRRVGWIVGRDTERMDAGEVVRAVVETVAENTVDAVVAPLFYAFIGGAPLAMFYRAVNTLDSMVGYHNERYRHFGFFSARLDDVLNFIPARLTVVVFLAAAFLQGLPVRRAWQVVRRDAGDHPSPNSGYPEAAVAGILGVRLGGLNYYHGQPSFRAYMGKEFAPPEQEAIGKTVRLMYSGATIFVLAGTLISAAINFFWL
ncbi:MAG: adenosylcobinamide-phosphate synthase [Eubacteriales bacterium]|nr:adenosylcobinamide-phosphate synthase [Eubacteriales bacterium]MDN5363960.1 adenosylcobinamide-phosphate synthase [Eubacteriales bacterium]